VWDLHACTILITYRQNRSSVNCFDCLGSDYFIVSQHETSNLHLWNWRKEQPLVKSATPEKISCLCATKDGTYISAGSESGNIYTWEVSTGKLIAIFEAHYKRVNVISFTDDDSFLISGGEDGTLSAWTLGSIVDLQNTDSPVAFHSWSDHNLPISAVYCGFGGIRARIVTTSLDRTCKIFDLRTKQVIQSFVFPTYLTAVVLDPHETLLFVGGGDSNIYKIDLFQQLGSTSLPFDPTQLKDEQHRKVLRGHNGAISSLSISFDGSILLSGSQDGTCIVWDPHTSQLLRSFTHHKGPITSVRIRLRPQDLFNLNAKTEKELKEHVTHLKKHKMKLAENEGESKPLHQVATNEELAASVWGKDDFSNFTNSRKRLKKHIKQTVDQIVSQDSQQQLQFEISRLQNEIEGINQRDERWKSVNNRLYQYCLTQMDK